MGAVKLIFIFLFVAVVYAQVRYLGGTLRDQAPSGMCRGRNDDNWSCGDARGSDGQPGFTGTDFQRDDYEAQEWGLAGAECNRNNQRTCGKLGAFPDETPQYVFTGRSPKGNILSPNSFYHWFHNTNQNKRVDFQIPLTAQGDTWVYSNDSFFPLDGRGWRDHAPKGGKRRNFAFCLEARTRFGYRGGEVFRFDGDDDVWVYIDNKLVIDLGSLHEKMSKSVALDTLGLTKGENYRLDFFYCERHTTESNLFLTTSLEFYCAYEDWCGKCEGNGQSCCTQEMLNGECNDNNACTIDSCKVRERGCEHTPRTCPNQDRCNIGSCDPRTGCVQTPLNCNPDNNKCIDASCNPSTGCVRREKDCDDNLECTIDSCDPNVGCVHRPVSCDDGDACTIDRYSNSTIGCCRPKTRRDCDDNNVCTIDSCDSATGCTYQNRQCDDGNLCTTDSCDRTRGCLFVQKQCTTTNKCLNAFCSNSTGECTTTPIPCTPANECEVAFCDAATGCTKSPKVCDDSDACTRDTCDPRVPGGCVFTPIPCDDGNACTNSTCSKTGGCVHLPLNYDDGNACTIDSCDPRTGVSRTNRTCQDNNPCTDDVCDPKSGCRAVQKNCADADPCTVDTCDRSVTTGDPCVHTRLDGCTTCKNATGSDLSCPTLDACFPSVCDTANKKCGNTTKICDDGNACTSDGCSNGECVSTPIVCPPQTCMDVSCDTTDGCKYTAKTCDDFNPCTNNICSSNGTCSNTNIYAFCEPCGGVACGYDDPCNPRVCNATTNQCELKRVLCDDGNACTENRCVASGTPRRAVCQNPTISCNTTDSCNPYICDTKLGCQLEPVNCHSENKCLIGLCNNTATGGDICQFSPKKCESDNPCVPKVCNPNTGACVDEPVVCDDNNPCTQDFCFVDPFGRATCDSTPKACDADQCGTKTCNVTNGLCETVRLDCDDGNKCTEDQFICNGTAAYCQYNQTTACDDDNLCTNEFCDSSKGVGTTENPCTYTNITCLPRNVCETVLPDCDPKTGCVYAPVFCPGQNDVCKVATCDERAGCILEQKICFVEDDGCFYADCDNTKPDGEQCVEKQKDNWGSRTSSKDGVICLFKYDATARNAAIGTGAAVGIAIGAAAAAGFIGYGGKKGYDYWKGMQDQRFDGVQNNPLYENTPSSADNPLYRHSTTL